MVDKWLEDAREAEREEIKMIAWEEKFLLQEMADELDDLEDQDDKNE
jgi:hypothetical protein